VTWKCFCEINLTFKEREEVLNKFKIKKIRIYSKAYTNFNTQILQDKYIISAL